MERLFLALRYVTHRPLAWVSVLGIWLSVAALLCVVGIMSGFLDEMRRVIRGTTADVVLTPVSGRTRSGRIVPPPPFDTVRAPLSGLDGVAAIAPHFLRPALLARSREDKKGRLLLRVEEAAPVELIGLDPAMERGVTAFADAVAAVGLEEGGVDDPAHPFAPPREAPEASRDLPVLLLGHALVEEQGLKKGDVVTLVTVPERRERTGQQGAPEVQSARFVVGGKVKTGHYQNDSSSAYASLDAAMRLSDSGRLASEICVRVEPGADVDLVAREIRERLRAHGLPVLVETWRQRHRRYLAGVENQRSILAFILFFFVVVACFNVFATLTLLVSDKVRDIGVLAALGAGTSRVAALFLLCAALLAGGGAVLGAASGVWLGHRLDRVNDLIERFFGVRIFRPDVYVFDHVPVKIEPSFVLLVVAATLLLALCSALVPAVRAARLRPVDALRHE